MKNSLKEIKIYNTMIIISIAVYIFMVFKFKELSFSTLNLIDFGAKYNYLILKGEYWRFLLPIFIHSGFMHIAMNMFSIYIIGRTIETIFGKVNFFIIYMLSGIGGVFFSFLFSNSISIGASGSVFGLLGSHVALYLKNRDLYKHVFGIDFLILIGINLLYGFTTTGIDNLGHIGGLVFGVITTYALIYSGSVKIFSNRFSFTRVLYFGILIISIYSAMFSFGRYRYINSGEYEFDSIYHLVSERKTDAVILEKVKKAYEKFPNNKKINNLYIQLKPFMKE